MVPLQQRRKKSTSLWLESFHREVFEPLTRLASERCWRNLIARDPGREIGKLIERVPEKTGSTVLNDFFLPALVDDDRDTACGHRFHGCHAEMLHPFGMAVFVAAKACRMPEYFRLIVEPPQHRVRLIDMEKDGEALIRTAQFLQEGR